MDNFIDSRSRTFTSDDDSKLSLERLRERHSSSWWQRKSIRFKTTLLAIAIATIPTLAVGSIGYYYAANSLERETIDLRKTLVEDLQDRVSVFMGDRLNDIEMMAQSNIFTDPSIRASTTAEAKSAALQKIQDTYDVYSSIAVFDAKGDLVAKTDGKVVGNHLDRGYIQAAIEADGAIVSSPRISTSSGVYSIYTASPIKDSVSGETIGFVRARMPVEALQQLLANYTNSGDRYYLLDRGEIFLGSDRNYVVKTLSNESVARQTYDYEAIDFSEIFKNTEILSSLNPTTDIAFNTQTNTEQFLTFAPLQTKAIPSLNWQAVIATDTATMFAPRRKLRQVFVIGVGIIALGVGAIAYYLTHRLLRPILLAARAVQKIGRGDFDTRLQIAGTDEFAKLGSDINRMAGQLSDFVETQTLLRQHSESLKNIALKLSTTTEQLEIIKLAVAQSALVLNANRIIYYQFETERSGTVVAEFVAPGYPTLKGRIFSTEKLRQYYAEYQSNTEGKISDPTVLAIDRIDRERLLSEINACLIAPVYIEDRLDGLLISAQYTTRKSWLDAEMEFVVQVAKQIGFAATRLKFQEQQRLAEIREKSAREILQQRALDLLQEVYDVSQGDLTIRARVTEDEIGTIADSYNSTIESLQNLVNQTKSAAIEVQSNTVANDMAIQSLAQKTVAQAAEIAQMRSRLAEMEQSIDLVSRQAKQARDSIEQAGTTIDRTDQSMDRTVAEINAVQDTITRTTAKAQRLGESSQAISSAVNTIGRFAAQTHLLALKASIEAARAGEQGRGFGVIAEEVRSLATQSAEATADIETLVNKIQLETSEVVEAMNQGRGQITQGSELVQQTRQNLTEVNQVSERINQLVDSIAKAAAEQSLTSVRVSQAMNTVAAIAENNSDSATQVSTSIKQLTAIALKLQTNIDKFRT